jgi:protein-L-isoaspartate(D-aspartate) O-methyltransferase
MNNIFCVTHVGKVNDLRGLAPWVEADLFYCFMATHDRHHDVDQDRLWVVLQGEIHTLLPIYCAEDIDPRNSKGGRIHFSDHFVIVGDQNGCIAHEVRISQIDPLGPQNTVYLQKQGMEEYTFYMIEKFTPLDMNNSNMRLIESLNRTGVLRTPAVEEAFLAVDRKDFVIEKYSGSTYVDKPLPIGFGQTISQPYTVAFLLELLAPQIGDRILDVGSGSGWTTALLAHLVGPEGQVWGVERIPELVQLGKNNIAKYSYQNVEIVEAGPEIGLKEYAPYDRILVSAAADEIPPGLLAQLKIGGVLVLPIRNAIWKVKRKSETEANIEKFEGFVFVPLIK